MRRLARSAREDLRERVRALLGTEAGRYIAVRQTIELDPALPERLRASALGVSQVAAAGVALPSTTPSAALPAGPTFGALTDRTEPAPPAGAWT
jgi:hypothetical protein